MKINDKLEKAWDLIAEVGEDVECELPTELNFINDELSEILEQLNSIIMKDIELKED